MMKLLIGPVATLIVCGCAHHDERTEALQSEPQNIVRVCELLTRGREFVGERIYVSGLYANDPHRRVLSGDNCPQVKKTLAVEIQGTKQELQTDRQMQKRLSATKNLGVPAVYYGLVKAEAQIVNCGEEACFSYLLVDAKLVSPRKMEH